jgi:hypothetical protein
MRFLRVILNNVSSGISVNHDKIELANEDCIILWSSNIVYQSAGKRIV